VSRLTSCAGRTLRNRGHQRLITFLGIVVLFLVTVYPLYETSYYIWTRPGWYRLAGTTTRAFLTDIRHGEIVRVLPVGDPELRRLMELQDANNADFERRTAIRIRPSPAVSQMHPSRAAQQFA